MSAGLWEIHAPWNQGDVKANAGTGINYLAWNRFDWLGGHIWEAAMTRFVSAYRFLC